MKTADGFSKETLDLKKRVLLQQKKAHAFSLRFGFRPIPITVIHQMEIHLHLCILSSPIPDGLKNPPVGRKCLLIFRFLNRDGKHPHALCDHRHQIGHDLVVAAVSDLLMKL